MISHAAIWIGLWFIWGFVVYQNPQLQLKDLTILIGGMWTLGGGICWVVLHVVRKLKALAESAPDKEA